MDRFGGRKEKEGKTTIWVMGKKIEGGRDDD
jgi:hypothetical protein